MGVKKGKKNYIIAFLLFCQEYGSFKRAEVLLPVFEFKTSHLVIFTGYIQS